MEFEAAAPRFVPLRIEEQNQIQPSMQPTCRMIVEVDMHIEILTVEVFMCSAAHVLGIVNQICDACDLSYKP